MDREDILWKAEKLVKQGRLNLAITEYKRVVDEYPEDWGTANTLGDLYVRAQQADKAVEQFSRIADHLAHEGFLPKAAALYKKALKVKPGDEHALLQAAEIAVRQGLLAEAKQYLAQVVTVRRSAGNLAGAAEVLVRVGTLDPDDVEARLVAARAVAEAGQGEVAAVEFLSVADELEARGRIDECVRVLEQALTVRPDEGVIVTRLIRVCAEHGEVSRARQHARTADDFRELAKIFGARGDEAAMAECLADVVRLDSTDAEAAAALVRDYFARGHLTAAHRYAALAGQTSDPDLLLVVGEVHAWSGEVEEARGVLSRLLARAPHLAPGVIELGVRLATQVPDAALACIESVASIQLLRGDFAAAAQAYERLLVEQPSNLTALMCLVELCMEGQLDDDLVSAQSRLVDAYLTHDRPLEARAVAEDLATRTQDPEHIDRFRRALVATGEPDPDRFIADRLGQTKEEPAAPALPVETPPPAATLPAGTMPVIVDVGAPTPPAEAPPERPARAASAADPFRLGPIAIDLGEILGDALDEGTGALPHTSPAVENDVTDRPKEPRRRAKPETPPTAAPPPAGEPPVSPAGSRPEEFFSDFHDEVAKQSDADIAEQHYKVGLTYRDMGMLPEAIGELELAVRSPRLRFEAAALLARLSLQRGDVAGAIEWFERAAEAPAPAADDARSLLYELGDTLEIGGESARALAVFLELQAEAKDYRDVARRVERLSRVQAGG
jgi:tetratricopeptide (TPR) repeat protein